VSRLLLALVLAALLLGPLAACGRKGDPFVPAGDTNTLTRKYPDKYPGDAAETVQTKPADQGKTDQTDQNKKVP